MAPAGNDNFRPNLESNTLGTLAGAPFLTIGVFGLNGRRSDPGPHLEDIAGDLFPQFRRRAKPPLRPQFHPDFHLEFLAIKGAIKNS